MQTVVKENVQTTKDLFPVDERRLETSDIFDIRALPSVIGENSKEKQHRLPSWFKIRRADRTVGVNCFVFQSFARHGLTSLVFQYFARHGLTSSGNA